MVRTEETDRYKLILLEGEDEIENHEMASEFKDQPTVKVEGKINSTDRVFAPGCEPKRHIWYLQQAQA